MNVALAIHSPLFRCGNSTEPPATEGRLPVLRAKQTRVYTASSRYDKKVVRAAQEERKTCGSSSESRVLMPEVTLP